MNKLTKFVCKLVDFTKNFEKPNIVVFHIQFNGWPNILHSMAKASDSDAITVWPDGIHTS